MKRAATLTALLLATTLLAGCSEGGRDSDSDGLRDGTERGGWNIIIDLMDQRIERRVTSDASMADTDGDGIDDFDEFFLKTDPQEIDTDGDGLTDCQEALHTVRAECEDPNHTEFDGGTDTDPANADSDPGPSRYKSQQPFLDTTGTIGPNAVRFGDGISDGDEVRGLTLTLPDGRTFQNVATNPRSTDSDDDGLEDGEEARTFGTRPDVPDTDGDGCTDGNDPVPESRQRYDLGLQTFRNAQSDDARVWIEAFAGDSDLRLPASGTRAVAAGTTWDMSSADSEVPPGTCGVSPTHPWITITLVVGAEGMAQNGVLDFYSSTPGLQGQGAKVAWNVRTNAFAWQHDLETTFQGPLTFSGPDATLRLNPRVA